MFYLVPESGTRQKLVPDCMTHVYQKLVPVFWYQFLYQFLLSMSWALSFSLLADTVI